MTQITMTSQPWIMRPGVNFFRNIQFRTKAVLISIAFLVPIVLLSWSFIDAKRAAINVAALEMDGVTYAKELVPAIKWARQYRRYTMQEQATGSTPNELAEVKSKLDAQIVKIKQLDAIYGEQFKTTDLLRKVEQLYQSSTPASSGLLTVFKTHSKFNEGLGQLLTAVADGSGLTLDPEIDTYYLMDASINAMATLLESTAKMRVLAASIARSGKDVEISTQELLQEEGLISYLSDVITSDLIKVTGEHPDFRSELNVEEPMKDVASLLQMSKENPGQGGNNRALIIDAQGKKVVDAFEKIQQVSLNHLNELLISRVKQQNQSLYITAAVVTLFLLSAAYMFVAFYRVMESGLRHANDNLHTMASGDLRTKIAPKGNDEITKLMLSMAEMQNSLVNMVSVMRSSSEQIGNSSGEVAQGSADMAVRTSQTLQRLQETAAAMVEISGTIQSTADSAQQATQLARENAQLATRGGEVIAEMVSTMEEIRNSSSKINDIIGVIDGIAFQTNILALNAAVEAARAGEAGRGFAVVATEVRALAHRSADAAKEIKNLITVSVNTVETGGHIVQNAGATMAQVVQSAAGISQFLSDISASAREQSIGVKEVEQAVQELDSVTQANATLVEETSASADTLRDLAVELVNEVHVFKLTQHG